MLDQFDKFIFDFKKDTLCILRNKDLQKRFVLIICTNSTKAVDY